MNVILHASDSRWGNAALITTWHVLERNFDTIGYSYVILNGHLAEDRYHPLFDGSVETGRPLDGDAFIDGNEIGAHVKGHNHSVGICLIGKSRTFTTNQYEALRGLLLELKKQYGEIELYQHSDFDENKPYCAGLRPSVMKALKCLL